MLESLGEKGVYSGIMLISECKVHSFLWNENSLQEHVKMFIKGKLLNHEKKPLKKLNV